MLKLPQTSRRSQRRRGRLVVAVAATGALSATVSAATPAFWTAASSGSWNEPANWSTNPFFPNNGNPAGSTYDVTLPSLPSQYTVSLSGNVIVNSLVDSAILSIGSSTPSGLLLKDDQTISGTGQISFDGSYPIAQDVIGSNGGTLTVSPSITIRSGAQGGFVGDYRGNLINQGTIAAQTAGQTLTINAASWTNTGTLRADAGTLALGGSFTTAGMGTIARTNGTLAITGALDNSNATLNLDSVGPVILSNGSISGGTVTGGAASPIVIPYLTADYDAGFIGNNLNFAGTVKVNPGGILKIKNGLTLNNAHLSFGPHGELRTLGNAQSLSGTGELLFDLDDGYTDVGVHQLSIGSGITIRDTTSTPVLTTGGLSLFLDRSTSAGLISSETPNRTVSVSGYPVGFTNTGTIQSVNGGNLAVEYANNSGQIKGNGGSFTVSHILSNTGTISAVNATVTLGAQDGSLTPVQLGSFIRTGGSLTLKGNFDATGTTFDLHDGVGSAILDGTITGGTVAGSGGEKIFVSALNRNGFLTGVTLAADMEVTNDNAVLVRNGLTLANSTVTLVSTGNTSELNFWGDQTLDGAGTVVFDNNTGDIHSADATGGSLPHTLTIGGDITVKTGTGNGNFSGPSNFTFVNNGTVLSQSAGKSLFFFGGNFINNGAMSSSNGGTLNLGGTWTNNGSITVNGGTLGLAALVGGGGTLSVTNSNLNLIGTFTTAQFRSLPLASNTVSLASQNAVLDATDDELHLNSSSGSLHLTPLSRLKGGRFSADPPYQYTLSSSGTYYFDGITLAAPITVPAGATLDVLNGLSLDNATLSLSSALASSSVTFPGTQTLTGTGAIVFDGSSPQNSIRPTLSGALTIGPGITIRTGSQGGIVGDSVSKKLPTINQGLISAQTIHTTISVYGSAFSNQGTLEVKNGGALDLGLTPFTNLANNTLTAGTYTVGAGSTLSFGTRTFANNAADVTLSGTNSTFAAIAPLAVNTGSFTITAGRDFSTAGALSNTGRLTAGAASDLTITGDLTAGAASILAIELSSAATSEGYGQFAATGQANLGGTIEADLATTYDLHPGDTFTVLSAASINGTFSSLSLPPNFAGDLTYTATSVQLTLTAVPEPAALPLLSLAPILFLARRRRASR